MSSVGVKVPVQVTPPSLLLMAVSVPFSSVMSLLSKPGHRFAKVIVRVDVSPALRSVSAITTLLITGSLVSTV